MYWNDREIVSLFEKCYSKQGDALMMRKLIKKKERLLRRDIGCVNLDNVCINDNWIKLKLSKKNEKDSMFWVVYNITLNRKNMVFGMGGYPVMNQRGLYEIMKTRNYKHFIKFISNKVNNNNNL